MIRHLIFRLRRWRYLLDTRHFCPGCYSRNIKMRAVEGQPVKGNTTMTIIEETCGYCGGQWYTEAMVKTENYLPSKQKV